MAPNVANDEAPPGFEWDPAKARRNDAIRGRPTFRDATTAFVDINRREAADERNSTESAVRWRLVGLTASGQLVTVAYTEWRPPEPGPIARRIGFAPFSDGQVRDATLLRSVQGDSRARRERIRLVHDTMPGVLVPEVVAAYLATYGPMRSIEWRPFVNAEPADRIDQGWQAPRPAVLSDGAIQTGFAIIED